MHVFAWVITSQIPNSVFWSDKGLSDLLEKQGLFFFEKNKTLKCIFLPEWLLGYILNNVFWGHKGLFDLFEKQCRFFWKKYIL